MDSDEDFQLIVSESPSSDDEMRWSIADDVQAESASSEDEFPVAGTLPRADSDELSGSDSSVTLPKPAGGTKRRRVFSSSDSDGSDSEIVLTTSIPSAASRKVLESPSTLSKPAPPAASGTRSSSSASAKKRRCVAYQTAWEEKPGLKGWLTKSKRTEGKAFCTVCQRDLEFQNGGAYDLERHGKSAVHRKLVDSTRTQRSLTSIGVEVERPVTICH